MFDIFNQYSPNFWHEIAHQSIFCWYYSPVECNKQRHYMRDILRLPADTEYFNEYPSLIAIL